MGGNITLRREFLLRFRTWSIRDLLNGLVANFSTTIRPCILTIANISTLATSHRNGHGLRRLALRPDRPQMVLPRVEHDDRLALRHATIDLVRVDGHASHSEGRPPRVAHELRDADEGARRRDRGRLHDCAKGGRGGGEDKNVYSGCCGQLLGARAFIAHRRVP